MRSQIELSDQYARETLYLFNERDYFAEKVDALVIEIDVLLDINGSLKRENSFLKTINENSAENLRIQKELYDSANQMFNSKEKVLRKKRIKNTIIVGGVAISTGIVIGVILAK